MDRKQRKNEKCGPYDNDKTKCFGIFSIFNKKKMQNRESNQILCSECHFLIKNEAINKYKSIKLQRTAI